MTTLPPSSAHAPERARHLPMSRTFSALSSQPKRFSDSSAVNSSAGRRRVGGVLTGSQLRAWIDLLRAGGYALRSVTASTAAAQGGRGHEGPWEALPAGLHPAGFRRPSAPAAVRR